MLDHPHLKSHHYVYEVDVHSAQYDETIAKIMDLIKLQLAPGEMLKKGVDFKIHFTEEQAKTCHADIVKLFNDKDIYLTNNHGIYTAIVKLNKNVIVRNSRERAEKRLETLGEILGKGGFASVTRFENTIKGEDSRTATKAIKQIRLIQKAKRDNATIVDVINDIYEEYIFTKAYFNLNGKNCHLSFAFNKQGELEAQLSIPRFDDVELFDLLSNISARTASLSFKKRVAMAIAITRDVTDLHFLGIVHRDLKTQNIIANRANGKARVIDLGCAALQNDEGTVIGTRTTIAPELLHARLPAVNVGLDVFALGIIYAELFGAHHAGEDRMSFYIPSVRWDSHFGMLMPLSNDEYAREWQKVYRMRQNYFEKRASRSLENAERFREKAEHYKELAKFPVTCRRDYAIDEYTLIGFLNFADLDLEKLGPIKNDLSIIVTLLGSSEPEHRPNLNTVVLTMLVRIHTLINMKHFLSLENDVIEKLYNAMDLLQIVVVEPAFDIDELNNALVLLKKYDIDIKSFVLNSFQHLAESTLEQLKLNIASLRKHHCDEIADVYQALFDKHKVLNDRIKPLTQDDMIDNGTELVLRQLKINYLNAVLLFIKQPMTEILGGNGKHKPRGLGNLQIYLKENSISSKKDLTALGDVALNAIYQNVSQKINSRLSIINYLSGLKRSEITQTFYQHRVNDAINIEALEKALQPDSEPELNATIKSMTFS